MKEIITLAVDIGKSSSRLMSGRFDGNRLTVKEEKRCEMIQSFLPDGWLYWDTIHVFSTIKAAISNFCIQNGEKPASLAFSSFGADFAILDKKGTFLGPMRHYLLNEKAHRFWKNYEETVDLYELFCKVGVDRGLYNAPFNLYLQKCCDSTALKNADRILGVADLFSFLFSGYPINELTCTGCLRLIDLDSNQFSHWLLEQIGINPFILRGEILWPGDYIGKPLMSVGDEIGCPDVKLVAVNGHDTTAAQLALPYCDEHTAFIGSGTSLTLCYPSNSINFSKELFDFNTCIVKGYNASNIILKNSYAGLWLLKAVLTEIGGGAAYDDLELMAKKSSPCLTFIDIDEGNFFDMHGTISKQIRTFCKLTNQAVPSSHAETIRCIMDSFGMNVRWCLEKMQHVVGCKIETLVVVGGGVYFHLFCETLANCSRRKVIAGPPEATSIGNMLCQLKALGEIEKISDMMEISKRSFESYVCEPDKNGDVWNSGYEYFCVMKSSWRNVISDLYKK